MSACREHSEQKNLEEPCQNPEGRSLILHTSSCGQTLLILWSGSFIGIMEQIEPPERHEHHTCALACVSICLAWWTSAHARGQPHWHKLRPSPYHLTR